MVALRKESVDRNFGVLDYDRPSVASLSARRAWIEMRGGWAAWLRKNVALRKESVDRNSVSIVSPLPVQGRSPQGERG